MHKHKQNDHTFNHLFFFDFALLAAQHVAEWCNLFPFLRPMTCLTSFVLVRHLGIFLRGESSVDQATSSKHTPLDSIDRCRQTVESSKLRTQRWHTHTHTHTPTNHLAWQTGSSAPFESYPFAHIHSNTCRESALRSIATFIINGIMIVITLLRSANGSGAAVLISLYVPGRTADQPAGDSDVDDEYDVWFCSTIGLLSGFLVSCDFFPQ